MKGRFPNSELIEAVKIFDPKSIPVSESECATYEEKELQLLTRQYSIFVDHNLCSLEWDTLKQSMKISYSGYSFHNFILKFATDQLFITHYPSIANLAEIILLFPSSTAEVERWFSYQNAMKNKFCNSLSSNHVRPITQITIKCFSTPQNFLFIGCINIGLRLSTVAM